MAFMDKVMFWKKKKGTDDLSDMGLGGDIGADPFAGPTGSPAGAGSPGAGSDPFGAGGDMGSATDTFGSSPQPQPGQGAFGAPPSDTGFGMNQGASSPPMQQTPSPQTSLSEPQPNQPYSVAAQSNAQSSLDTSEHQTYMTNKNLEVLSSKLDALRASIDSMSQRLQNIERLAYGDQERRKRDW